MLPSYRASFCSGVYGTYRTDFNALNVLKQNEATLQCLTADYFEYVTTRGNDLISHNARYIAYAMQQCEEIRHERRIDEYKQETPNNHEEELALIQTLSRQLDEQVNHSVQQLLFDVSSEIDKLTKCHHNQQKILMGIYHGDALHGAADESVKQRYFRLFFKMNTEIEARQKSLLQAMDKAREQLTRMEQHSDMQRTQILNVLVKLQQSIEKIFEFAKQIYRQQQSPVIVDQHNVLQDVKQNAHHYKNVALPMTLGQDQPFSSWDEEQFKREFSTKFDIPIKCVHIVSVKAGSTVIDLKLTTHATGTKMLIPIECIADRISTKQAKKEMAEFGIFAMEFKQPEDAFKNLQKRVIMNPRWNREYGTGQGQTHWKGALNDGKSRAGEPYHCPLGWKRYAVQFDEVAYDFDHVYDDWPIAYHGTTFDAPMLITLSGLKCSEKKPGCAVHGTGVYLSPSIKYVAHPGRYCVPVRLDLSKKKQAEWSKENLKEWRNYHGKWIQCAFACRVKPGSYSKHRETMRLRVDGTFNGIDKREIEWLVPGKPGEIIGSDKILIYGYMIKVSDHKPPDGYDPADVNGNADVNAEGCVVM